MADLANFFFVLMLVPAIALVVFLYDLWDERKEKRRLKKLAIKR